MVERLPWELPETPKRPEQVGFVVDLRRCVGCHACSVSCKTEHAVPLGHFRMRTQVVPRPDSPKLAFAPTLCLHCEDAPCVTACPTEALTRKADGRVVVDKSRCASTAACVPACPYGAISLHPETGQAEKCDLCENRNEVGLGPACVEVCPTGALRFGDLADESDPIGALYRAATAHKPEERTRPRVRHLGYEAWMSEGLPGVQLEDGEAGIVYES